MKCNVDFCKNKQHVSGKGYCRRHYDQIRKYGRILDTRTNYDPNEFIINNGYVEIVLRDKNGSEVGRAIVDIDDYEKVADRKWSKNDNGYVRSFINTKPLYLHRYLLGLTSDDLEVDHINADKLDNRKANLRTCEHWVNAGNLGTSRGKTLGIVKTKRNLSKPYLVRVKRKKRSYYVGYFKTYEEAETARLSAERGLNSMLGI